MQKNFSLIVQNRQSQDIHNSVGCLNAGLVTTAVWCILCANGILMDPGLTLTKSAYTCKSFCFVLFVADERSCNEAQVPDELMLCGCSGIASPNFATLSLSRMGTIQSMGGGGMGGMDFVGFCVGGMRGGGVGKLRGGVE